MEEQTISCVSPRCVLCALPLPDVDDDDNDIFVGSWCLTSYGRQDFDKLLASQAFPEFQPATYCACRVNCQHPKGLAYGCHSVCSQAGLPSLATCKVICWDNDFSLSEARSFEYERQLMRNGNAMLDIARSSMLIEADVTRPCQVEVNTSGCIWATYVTLRGESYLSTLSNEAGDQLVYDPTAFPTADIIYIARGPLGVQNIVFACSTDELELETPLWNWWQDVPFTNRGSIHFDFDGLKIRNLYGNHEDDRGRPMWSAPSLRPSLVHFPLVQYSGPARFNRIMVNHPETTGYSIAWNAAYRALTIVPHTTSSDLRCYSEFPEGTMWFHIALSSGELLKEVWRRDCHLHPRKKVDLIIITSDDKVHILGPHERSNQSYSYSLLASLRESPHYAYMDDSVGFVRELAFDQRPGGCNSTWEDYKQVPLSLNPGERPNNWNVSESFFYTSARLGDLVGLNLCQSDGMVTGLLLHYENRSLATVGQVRLDRLQGERRQVPKNATIRFTVSRTRRQCPYVSGLLIFTDQTEKPPLKDGVDLDVECRGILEWWFTRRQCQLAYKSCTSASTCL